MISEKKLNVVFAIDQFYIQHFCVAVTSLLENNLKIINKIFLINDIENNFSLNQTIKFINKKYNIKIINIFFDTSLVKNFKIDGHITHASYYRIFLTELLPRDVERVLFLDSDVIVNGCIKYFLSLNFQPDVANNLPKILHQKSNIRKEYFLYAISNLFDQNKERLKDLGLCGAQYFNAGVLYIDLKQWRENNIINKFIFVANEFKEKLYLHDQDVMNIVLENYWLEIDEKFNAIGLEFSNKKIDIKDYIIIHFTNFPKPWHFKNSHPFKWLYYYYIWKTPYRLYIPKDLNLYNLYKFKIIPRVNHLKDRLMRLNLKTIKRKIFRLY
ncbi:glycosyltransferase family 8 protein [Pleomorphovibrio marinus]|uniref:glycosyltransferase family 8 protein n=1 Tax=Pleomorphovibrio marinus TaxID=2164132 RepID=UPI000E0A27A2|nr:glycosyltransferase family 8 protein [Pleomorphovibrio marinus]